MIRIDKIKMFFFCSEILFNNILVKMVNSKIKFLKYYLDFIFFKLNKFGFIFILLIVFVYV